MFYPPGADRDNLAAYNGPNLEYFKKGTNEAFLKYLAARKINSKFLSN